MSLFLTLPLLVLLVMPKEKPRLHWPLWVTVAACALPGFFYQNTGYAQFGFRFSIHLHAVPVAAARRWRVEPEEGAAGCVAGAGRAGELLGRARLQGLHRAGSRLVMIGRGSGGTACLLRSVPRPRERQPMHS